MQIRFADLPALEPKKMEDLELECSIRTLINVIDACAHILSNYWCHQNFQQAVVPKLTKAVEDLGRCLDECNRRKEAMR